MRRLFTTEDARAEGLSSSALRWGERVGRWVRVERGVYADGPEPVAALDRARAAVVASAGVASGCLAGVLLGFDGVVLRGVDVTVSPSSNGRRAGARRRALPPERIVVVDGVRCTDALQTLVDLAAILDDDIWEQALETALRRRLTDVGALEPAAAVYAARRASAACSRGEAGPCRPPRVCWRR